MSVIMFILVLYLLYYSILEEISLYDENKKRKRKNKRRQNGVADKKSTVRKRTKSKKSKHLKIVK